MSEHVQPVLTLPRAVVIAALILGIALLQLARAQPRYAFAGQFREGLIQRLDVRTGHVSVCRIEADESASNPAPYAFACPAK